jgi:hypothetical protein
VGRLGVEDSFAMSTPTTIDHKRGDTFTKAGLLPAGALYAGGTWVAKADAVEKLGGVRHALAAQLIAPIAPDTRYTLHLFAPASAVQTWRVGKLECDVEFLDTAAEGEPFKASSLTFVINLKADVTV